VKYFSITTKLFTFDKGIIFIKLDKIVHYWILQNKTLERAQARVAGWWSYHFPAKFSIHFFEAGFENNNSCAFASVTHQSVDAEFSHDEDADHFLLEVEVGQLPRPAAAPPGIISSKYCLWSCSAAWRCSSINYQALAMMMGTGSGASSTTNTSSSSNNSKSQNGSAASQMMELQRQAAEQLQRQYLLEMMPGGAAAGLGSWPTSTSSKK
jgi:hypothetical protein